MVLLKVRLDLYRRHGVLNNVGCGGCANAHASLLSSRVPCHFDQTGNSYFIKIHILDVVASVLDTNLLIQDIVSAIRRLV